MSATAAAGIGNALAAAPDVGTVFWHPDETYCRFVHAEAGDPENDKPDSWRFLFVSELSHDDLASVERGYARIDGLLRELDFVSRRQTENGEVRAYWTFGEDRLSVDLDLTAGAGEKSKLGQTILVHYTGTLSVGRGDSLRVIPLKGSCGVEPGS